MSSEDVDMDHDHDRDQNQEWSHSQAHSHTHSHSHSFNALLVAADIARQRLPSDNGNLFGQRGSTDNTEFLPSWLDSTESTTRQSTCGNAIARSQVKVENVSNHGADDIIIESQDSSESTARQSYYVDAYSRVKLEDGSDVAAVDTSSEAQIAIVTGYATRAGQSISAWGAGGSGGGGGSVLSVPAQTDIKPSSERTLAPPSAEQHQHQHHGQRELASGVLASGVSVPSETLTRTTRRLDDPRPVQPRLSVADPAVLSIPKTAFSRILSAHSVPVPHALEAKVRTASVPPLLFSLCTCAWEAKCMNGDDDQEAEAKAKVQKERDDTFFTENNKLLLLESDINHTRTLNHNASSSLSRGSHGSIGGSLCNKHSDDKHTTVTAREPSRTLFDAQSVLDGVTIGHDHWRREQWDPIHPPSPLDIPAAEAQRGSSDEIPLSRANERDGDNNEVGMLGMETLPSLSARKATHNDEDNRRFFAFDNNNQADQGIAIQGRGGERKGVEGYLHDYLHLQDNNALLPYRSELSTSWLSTLLASLGPALDQARTKKHQQQEQQGQGVNEKHTLAASHQQGQYVRTSRCSCNDTFIPPRSTLQPKHNPQPRAPLLSVLILAPALPVDCPDLETPRTSDKLDSVPVTSQQLSSFHLSPLFSPLISPPPPPLSSRPAAAAATISLSLSASRRRIRTLAPIPLPPAYAHAPGRRVDQTKALVPSQLQANSSAPSPRRSPYSIPITPSANNNQSHQFRRTLGNNNNNAPTPVPAPGSPFAPFSPSPSPSLFSPFKSCSLPFLSPSPLSPHHHRQATTAYSRYTPHHIPTSLFSLQRETDNTPLLQRNKTKMGETMMTVASSSASTPVHNSSTTSTASTPPLATHSSSPATPPRDTSCGSATTSTSSPSSRLHSPPSMSLSKRRRAPEWPSPRSDRLATASNNSASAALASMALPTPTGGSTFPSSRDKYGLDQTMDTPAILRVPPTPLYSPAFHRSGYGHRPKSPHRGVGSDAPPTAGLPASAVSIQKLQPPLHSAPLSPRHPAHRSAPTVHAARLEQAPSPTGIAGSSSGSGSGSGSSASGSGTYAAGTPYAHVPSSADRVKMYGMHRGWVIEQLNKRAPQYWHQPTSSDLRILVPVPRSRLRGNNGLQPQPSSQPNSGASIHSNQPGHAPAPWGASPLMPQGDGLLQHVQQSVHTRGRRGSMPSEDEIVVLVFPLHQDYLITQSTLVRTILSSSSSHLDLVYAIPPTPGLPPSLTATPGHGSARSTAPLRPSSANSTSHASPSAPSAAAPSAPNAPRIVKGARLLPTPPGEPRAIYLPLPDPASFSVVVHWLYWGDITALEAALNKGLVEWQGVVKNVHYLGLDDNVKRVMGRWWRKWIKTDEGRARSAAGRGKGGGGTGTGTGMQNQGGGSDDESVESEEELMSDEEEGEHGHARRSEGSGGSGGMQVEGAGEEGMYALRRVSAGGIADDDGVSGLLRAL